MQKEREKQNKKEKGIIKRFLEWIGLKEKLHEKESVPPFFKEAEIWWCYFGENVGSEINGKGDGFTRPVFVFKKYDKFSFLGLPLTTKIKTGSWYVEISFNNKSQIVVLSQGRVFSYKRFKEKIGQLDKNDTKKVRDAYYKLHCP